MEPTRSFKELVVWQKAHEFVLLVYRVTSKFPPEERYGLTSQLRRAAVSIPANIAEAYGRRSQKEKRRFLNIAQGSLQECKYYLLLARDLHFYEDNKLDELLEEVSKLLNSYTRAIKV